MKRTTTRTNSLSLSLLFSTPALAAMHHQRPLFPLQPALSLQHPLLPPPPSSQHLFLIRALPLPPSSPPSDCALHNHCVPEDHTAKDTPLRSLGLTKEAARAPLLSLPSASPAYDQWWSLLSGETPGQHTAVSVICCLSACLRWLYPVLCCAVLCFAQRSSPLALLSSAELSSALVSLPLSLSLSFSL